MTASTLVMWKHCRRGTNYYWPLLDLQNSQDRELYSRGVGDWCVSCYNLKVHNSICCSVVAMYVFSHAIDYFCLTYFAEYTFFLFDYCDFQNNDICKKIFLITSVPLSISLQFSMGNCKISDDLKEASLCMKARLYPDEEVLTVVGFSRSTLKQAACHKALTGSVAKKQAIGCGCPCILEFSDSKYLLKLAQFKPTLFLDEYARHLEEGRFLDASLATIHWTLARAGLNINQVQKLAAERSPTVRADFVRRISHYPAKYLMCLDEVSKDDRTYARLWGRSRTGTCIEHHAPFVRKHQFQWLLRWHWMRE